MKQQKVFIIVVIIAIAITSSFLYYKFVTPMNSSVKLAAGFPVIPIYPSAKLISSVSDPHEGETYFGVRYGATWVSDEEVSKISAWYIDKLKSSGWSIFSLPANPKANDIQLVTFSNSEYSLNMSFVKDNDKNKTLITAEFSRSYSLGVPPKEMELEK